MPADQQALQVELGRDAQVEVDVERVVVGDEGPGRGAAGDRLHHRRLDLEEAARVEERADARARAPRAPEDPPRLRVGDEVDVALAVAQLDVGQAVPLLRQRPQRLGEERQIARRDRQLAGPGAEEGRPRRRRCRRGRGCRAASRAGSGGGPGGRRAGASRRPSWRSRNVGLAVLADGRAPARARAGAAGSAASSSSAVVRRPSARARRRARGPIEARAGKARHRRQRGPRACARRFWICSSSSDMAVLRRIAARRGRLPAEPRTYSPNRCYLSDPLRLSFSRRQ